MEQHNPHISLQEWIDDNAKLGINQDDSIRSYTEFVVEQLDKKSTVEVVALMFKSLLDIKKDALELSESYDRLYKSHRKMAEEMFTLLNILKGSTPK
jgi:hypothetical protein